MSQYVLWALFLLVQNASFTFVSRARNSGSYALHAIAAVLSNGVWIASQFISIAIIIEVIRTGSLEKKIGVVLFYTFFTVLGSIGMHWVGINWIEKGKRKVGG